MKLNKIAKLCKRSMAVHILNEHVDVDPLLDCWGQVDVEEGRVRLSGTQWMGDGNAFYKLRGMPQIVTASQWFRQYDVPDKKAGDYWFSHAEMYKYFNWDDYTRGEKVADIFGATIGCAGIVLKGVYATDDGEVQMIDTRYLEPIEDILRTEITIRHMQNGRAYICIREGMELVAIILPVRFGATARSMNTENELERLLDVIKNQIREANENTEQSNSDGPSDP